MCGATISICVRSFKIGLNLNDETNRVEHMKIGELDKLVGPITVILGTKMISEDLSLRAG